MTAMPAYAKTASLVGLIGIPIGMILMFMTMGLPVGNLLLAIPLGAVTTILILRQQTADSLDSRRRIVFQAGLISGSISVIGMAIPLTVLALLAPPTATIGQEFAKSIDPSRIPPLINDFRVAVALGGLLTALMITGLTAASSAITLKLKQERDNNRSGG
ncbi:MAG: hypothetical protein CO064_09250 [Anaerolineae bacterium CG_4_9_14_0_8_um_filter_58_9]|nr:MAG: hypothetical protein CO064_09250 [Anaerolineae bacterium CG_4_9_14_0_8_um_filter_58_9]